MKYAVVFLVVAILLGRAAIGGSPVRLLFWWPSVSFAVVAAAYAGLGPRVFGKRSDGTLHPFHTVLLLPYLAVTWSLWHLSRLLRREPPYHLLTERIYIGRRLLPHEYPAQIETVVDLTCEFAEPGDVRNGRTYRVLPTLDATAPREDALATLLDEVVGTRGSVYIHCAEGHGRTGLAAAALLLLLGNAEEANEAVALVRDRRPKARLNASQKRAVVSFASRIKDRAR